MSHDHDGPHEHDLGLAHDLPTLLNRRRALGLLSAAGLAAALAACGSGDSSGDSASASTQTRGGTGGGTGGGGPGPAESSVEVADGEIPEETGGPYPADGTNGVNVLTQSGVVRSDITTSFGGADGVAAGVPLTLSLTLLDMNDGDVTPYEGAAIYLWHCDREGRYSMYDDAVRSENYLRGVQAADSAGKVTFTSIFPGAYAGRWPHIHFEVYPSSASAQKATGKLRTSQIALPEAACRQAYATAGYEASVANLAGTSLESDNVFGDGHSLQLGKATGSVDDGFTVSLTIAV